MALYSLIKNPDRLKTDSHDLSVNAPLEQSLHCGYIAQECNQRLCWPRRLIISSVNVMSTWGFMNRTVDRVSSAVTSDRAHRLGAHRCCVDFIYTWLWRSGRDFFFLNPAMGIPAHKSLGIRLHIYTYSISKWHTQQFSLRRLFLFRMAVVPCHRMRDVIRPRGNKAGTELDVTIAALDRS